jgi:hypothetical protein
MDSHSHVQDSSPAHPECYEGLPHLTVFGLKRDEVTGYWRKLHNKELHNLTFAKYNKNDQVKEDEMGRACGTHRSIYRGLVQKSEGKRQ